jgi:hypothetical protein
MLCVLTWISEEVPELGARERPLSHTAAGTMRKQYGGGSGYSYCCLQFRLLCSLGSVQVLRAESAAPAANRSTDTRKHLLNAGCIIVHERTPELATASAAILCVEPFAPRKLAALYLQYFCCFWQYT